jgi:pimeloyl-ACP methyl ester carboxylesterase
MKMRLGDFQCVYDRVGKGPDLTLLHSVGLSTREGWRYQIPALAEHFRVLSFDFRGLGQSEQGSHPSRVDTFVQDLENLLAELKISQTIVMGISLGGFVAQAFALKRPETVSALVLVSTTCGHLAMNAPNRNERIARVRKLGMAGAADEQLEKQFAPDFAAAHPEILRWYRQHYLANDPLVYADVLEDLGRVSFCDQLHAIKCPTLIVAGDSDQSVVAGQGPLDSPTKLKSLVAGSNLAVIPDAKHYPQIDHAEVFNVVVLDFLRRKVKPKLC